MMKLFPIVAVGLMLHSAERGLGVEKEGILLREGFDDEEKSALAKRLIGHRHVTLAKGAGADGTDAIRVAYVGYERGSERVVMKHSLGAKVKEGTLSFQVKFDRDFQWVLGGKLHGLGPKDPLTGGQQRKATGWSARMMFRGGGRLSPYLYDQDAAKKWGVGRVTQDAVFTAGKWHRVVFQVRLNDPGKSNGMARVFVDEQLVAGEDEVMFRGAGGEETLIQQFLFSTFHGGQSPRYAPVDEEGKPTTVFAYYDDFVIRKGIR